MQSTVTVYRIKGRISNVYLIMGERIVLVDTGSPNDLQAILDALRSLGRSLTDIDLLVPTHAHIEHMGNARKIKRLTRTCIVLPARYLAPARDIFRSPQFLLDSARSIFAGIRHNPSLLLHPFMHIRPLTADIIATDGMDLPGHPGWSIIFTPGHSPESICLYQSETHTLISGDTVIVINGKAALPFGILDKRRMRQTIQRLQHLGIERLYPGHGEPLTGHGLLETIQVPIQTDLPV
jgi:hydroxyacylglutathione hydrolase